MNNRKRRKTSNKENIITPDSRPNNNEDNAKIIPKNESKEKPNQKSENKYTRRNNGCNSKKSKEESNVNEHKANISEASLKKLENPKSPLTHTYNDNIKINSCQMHTSTNTISPRISPNSSQDHISANNRVPPNLKSPIINNFISDPVIGVSNCHNKDTPKNDAFQQKSKTVNFSSSKNSIERLSGRTSNFSAKEDMNKLSGVQNSSNRDVLTSQKYNGFQNDVVIKEEIHYEESMNILSCRAGSSRIEEYANKRSGVQNSSNREVLADQKLNGFQNDVVIKEDIPEESVKILSCQAKGAVVNSGVQDSTDIAVFTAQKLNGFQKEFVIKEEISYEESDEILDCRADNSFSVGENGNEPSASSSELGAPKEFLGVDIKKEIPDVYQDLYKNHEIKNEIVIGPEIFQSNQQTEIQDPQTIHVNPDEVDTPDITNINGHLEVSERVQKSSTSEDLLDQEMKKEIVINSVTFLTSRESDKNTNTSRNWTSFHCDMCDKTFRYRLALNLHKTTHKSTTHSRSLCEVTLDTKEQISNEIDTSLKTGKKNIKNKASKPNKQKHNTKKKSLKQEILKNIIKKHKTQENITEKHKKQEEVAEKTSLKQEMQKEAAEKKIPKPNIQKNTTEKKILKQKTHKETVGNKTQNPHTQKNIKDKNTLKKHNKEIDESEKTTKKHICDYCNTAFTIKQYLITHIRKKHINNMTVKENKNLDLKCHICEKIFTMNHNLRRHIESMHIEKRFPCTFCCKKFTRNDYLIAHLRTHTSKITNSEVKVCEFCGKHYNDKSNFRRHRLKCGGESQKTREDAEKVPCNICKKLFSSNMLNQHMTRWHPDPKKAKYLCKYCDKIFSWKCDLECHLTSHVNGKNIECDICNKKFTTTRAMHRHKYIHNDIKPFSCSICHKGYTRRGLLKSHIMTHNSKLTSCEICHKIIRSTQKKYHEIKCKDICSAKPFVCDICKKRFVNKSDIETHIKKAHNREFTCDYCKRSFSNKNTLKEHINLHLGTFLCKICGKKFLNKQRYDEHIVVHSGKRSYSCDKCDKTFLYKTNYSHHKRHVCPYRLNAIGKLTTVTM